MALVRVPVGCDGERRSLADAFHKRSRTGSKPFRDDGRLRLVSSVTHEERREEGKVLP